MADNCFLMRREMPGLGGRIKDGEQFGDVHGAGEWSDDGLGELVHFVGIEDFVPAGAGKDVEVFLSPRSVNYEIELLDTLTRNEGLCFCIPSVAQRGSATAKFFHFVVFAIVCSRLP